MHASRIEARVNDFDFRTLVTFLNRFTAGKSVDDQPRVNLDITITCSKRTFDCTDYLRRWLNCCSKQQIMSTFTRSYNVHLDCSESVANFASRVRNVIINTDVRWDQHDAFALNRAVETAAIRQFMLQ